MGLHEWVRRGGKLVCSAVENIPHAAVAWEPHTTEPLTGSLHALAKQQEGTAKR